MLEAFGEIETMEPGKYIERKDKFVLKVKYKNKGNIPGTMSLVKDGEKWFIKDWNIDGQGEPELKE